MRKTIIASAATISVLALPALAFAQTGTLQGIFATVASIIQALVGILFTLAIVAFFWGLGRYLFSSGDEKSKGLNTMLMGILAIFVMASLYGLVGILQRTL